MKNFLTYLHFINEMKINTIPYDWNWIMKKGFAAEAQFYSIDTEDDYLVSISPWRKDEAVVEFSSKKLKSDLYSKSSPISVSKIISTVLQIMKIYLEENPNMVLSFTGSDEKRTRVYKLLLNSNQFQDLHYKFDKDDSIYIALKETPIKF